MADSGKLGEIVGPPRLAQLWAQSELFTQSESETPQRWIWPNIHGPQAYCSAVEKRLSWSPAWASHVSTFTAVSHPPTVHCCEEPSCVFSSPSISVQDAVECSQAIPSPGWTSPGPAASLHRTRAPATVSPESLWVSFLYRAAKTRHRPSVETMTLVFVLFNSSHML